MICAIHQPQTFPWLGYLAKIIQSDIFIFLDNVQFKKNEWQNRNKVKCNNNWQWLTIPVKHHFGQKISEVTLNSSINWQHKHLQTLKTCYGKAPHFREYFPELEEIYMNEWKKLADFNIKTIRWLMDKIGIRTRTLLSSKIEYLQNPTKMTADERLITITKFVGADVYLSGAGGRDYLDMELFPKNNIEVRFQKYEHPVYQQLHDNFITNLSVIDLLFNKGPESLKIIEGGIR